MSRRTHREIRRAYKTYLHELEQDHPKMFERARDFLETPIHSRVSRNRRN